jgi:hypothetical protein
MIEMVLEEALDEGYLWGAISDVLGPLPFLGREWSAPEDDNDEDNQSCINEHHGEFKARDDAHMAAPLTLSSRVDGRVRLQGMAQVRVAESKHDGCISAE